MTGLHDHRIALDAQPAGAELLDTIHAFLTRFVAYPTAHNAVAHTLWIAHTHLMDAWESTPRIAFLSPEPGSGKTRALEITELLVPRPVEAVNVTPAYLFRKVGDEAGRPTILFDEVDTVFGPRTAQNNEEVRGLLNAGHRRGAVAGRCVLRGKKVETEEIPAYCAVALAGLNDLPDTIMTRSVVIQMRRRAPDETVEPYRRRLHAPEGEDLHKHLAEWAHAVLPVVDGAMPDMPHGITDRPADVWEPLLAVADAAGGSWPARARASAIAHVTRPAQQTPSLGVRLLADLRGIFGTDVHALPTDTILARLNQLDEAPWGDLRGRALNARGLAQRLRKYGVSSGNIRYGDSVVKGYKREDLHDPWRRYLDAEPGAGAVPAGGATSATPLQPQVSDPPDVAAPPSRSATASATATPQQAADQPISGCSGSSALPTEGAGAPVHDVNGRWIGGPL